MAKRNKTKSPDEEILKHYISYDEHDTPGGIQKLAEDAGSALRSKPAYIKAKISVDKMMSGRKNAVIPDPAKKNAPKKKVSSPRKKNK